MSPRLMALGTGLLLAGCSVFGAGGAPSAGPACPPQAASCSGLCTDLRSDPLNCGTCGRACTDGQVCAAGACADQCLPGTAACAGTCADLSRDTRHCGTCGRACPEGLTCTEGSCSLRCVGGTVACGDACVTLASDPAHCGECDNACPAGNVCANGSCSAACGPGTLACGGSCADTDTDEAHCGTCGNTCATGQLCVQGTCKRECGAGESPCEGQCVITARDRLHCGGCNLACHPDQDCVDGVCRLKCPPGTFDCSGTCVSTGSNPQHCGACNNACASGEVCSNGQCLVQCLGGTTLCGARCATLSSDPQHCGACSNVCAQGEVCASGTCALQCGGGTTRCGSACANTRTDPAHCGGCNLACAANQYCAGGTCVGATCMPGSEQTCYSGPLTTVGVGACRSGRRTCNATGTAWSACVGEVLPTSDLCTDTLDNDCDGLVNNGCLPTSCRSVRVAFPTARSGVYLVDPDADGPLAPVQAYCDLERDGGGWTLAVKSWYLSGVTGNAGAVGTVAAAGTLKGAGYKLADDVIRAIIGQGGNFDVLADQVGFNSAYSAGNFEYVVIRNYTGLWQFTGTVAASTTPTTMQSYRSSDASLAWTGTLSCGEPGFGINCFTVTGGPNPQGGAGCTVNMGTASNTAWHHVYMAFSNTDSFLYVCNGAQHSSGQNMNHRWFIRERP